MPMPAFRRRKGVAVAVIVLAAIVGFVATKGPAPPTPNPAGTFSFAALADAPYFGWEELQYKLVLRELAASDVTAVIHAGDIFWRPCSDDHYRETLARFNAIGHPVMYTPGDNEWADCWKKQEGGYRPLDRLAKIRQIFFTNHDQLTRQPGFVENARWQQHGVFFATVHMIGSGNGTEPFPGRTAADDAAAKERAAAGEAWMRATFAAASAAHARAVVIAFHASPGFELPKGHKERAPFESFLTVLHDESARFAKPVLIVHADEHIFTVDHPLGLANVTRMEVPGSPLVGWVRVFVTSTGRARFSFEEHVVPRWKYW
jgi:hypothetical protein